MTHVHGDASSGLSLRWDALPGVPVGERASFRRQAWSLVELLARRHEEAAADGLDAYIEGLVAARPLLRPSEDELALLAQGTDTIRNGTQWLNAEDVAAARAAVQRLPAAGNRAGLASRWKGEGRIFAVSMAGRDCFPRYVFDESFEPIPAARDVIQCFDGRSGWSLAAWFESPSSALGGLRPRDELALHPARVLEAARAFVE